MKLNKRVTALILAVAMAFSSPCTASAAVQNTEPIVIADSGAVLDSGKLPPEPSYYSAEYANLLAAWDAQQAKAGKPTQLWMNYMVKWGKAIPYKATPDNYVYKQPNPKGRAATIPISSLPMGAKMVDTNTAWYGEPLIWIKISNDVLQPKNMTDEQTSQPHLYGGDGNWDKYTLRYSVNTTKQLWSAEQSISRLPIDATYGSLFYPNRTLRGWLTTTTFQNSNEFKTFFGFNFLDSVISPNLKKYMMPSAPSESITARRFWKDKNYDIYFDWVALPPSGQEYGIGFNGWAGDGYRFPYFANNCLGTTKRAKTHKVFVSPRYPPNMTNHEWYGVDLPNRIFTSQTTNSTDYYYLNVLGTDGQQSEEYCISSKASEYAAIPSGEIRPTIALKEDTQVYSTPDSNGIYTLVGNLIAPTVRQSINKSTNTATITGSSAAATSMEVTGNGLSGQVSGSSISKPTMKNGTYQVVARSGSASLSTPIAVSELDNTASANAYAAPSPTGWAQSKTTTITITDATTSGIQYSLNGGAWTNYTAPIKHTFTANGSITVKSRDKWGYTSGVTTITASQIDTTPPTAPTVTKSPVAAWHNNNVTVTVSGGGDAQSGVNRYQYSINGGAWTNYTAPFVVSATSTINARTVDNVGLASGNTGISVNIDRAAPTGTISYDKAWTNNALGLSFTASDLGGSGIAKVRPAGGTWASGGSAKQTISANGTYSFESADNAGNTSVTSVTVSNIDKTLPAVDEINFIKTSDSLFRMLFNKQVEISIVTSDNASGVASVEYQLVPEGGNIDGSAWLTYSAASKPRVAQRFHGTVAARCTDVAANISAVKQEEVTVESTPPTASHTLSTDDWTNAPVTITVTALDDLSGVDNIRLPDGTVVQGDIVQYTAPQNGKYSFIVTDKCGNAFTYDVDIGNIDLTAATATHTLSPGDFTNTDVVITVTAEDEESGVKSIILPDGSVIDGKIASLTVSKNDTFNFIVTNVVGITTKYDVQVSNTDYVPPEITGFALREVEENPVRKFLRGVFPAMFAKQVDLLITAEDDYSGINTIKYQVTDRGAPLQDSGWRVCGSGKPPRLAEEMDATVAVRTTDNAGNVSAIVSKDAVIDGSAPIGSHSLSTTDWVRTYIDIFVAAKDKWTKAAYITLPDGKMVNGDAAVFRAVRNGDYPFILTDELGNSGTYTVTIGNIDYVQPEITGFALREVEENPVRKFLRGVFPAMFAKQVELLVTAEDDYSGIKIIEYQVTDKGAPLQDSGWRVCDSGKPPRLSEEMDATVAVRTTDNAGNVSAIVSKDAVIDGSAPIGSHSLSTTDWVRTYIDISVTAKDKWTKAAYITLPDGKMVNGDAAVFRAVRNGDYPFILTDELGNSGVYTVTIGNIEEWQPTPPKMGVEEDAELTDELYIPDDAELGWDISRIDVKSLAQSGIEKYQYISTPRIIPAPPIDEQPQMRARMAGTAPEWKDCGEEITEAGEGIYDVEVRAVTYAGNVSEVSHYVLKNDYTPPTGTNKNDSRSIEFTAADALSGVAKISCEHGEVLGEAVTCEMLKTETHVYTVTDNAGASAEIPVEFVRPSSNNQDGSDESGPEPWVEGDEPSASIPLPVPPSTDNGALTDAAETAPGGGVKRDDESGGETVKGEDITVQPMPGGSSESIDGRSGIFARLWDALKALFARLAELLQRLWAWFMSLPLAVRIIIFTLWWLLLAAMAYYLWRKYKREKKKTAEKVEG